MAYTQTFDTSKFGTGLFDRCADMARVAREVGEEMFNLSVRNFESTAKAGRELASVRDFGQAARIQADYLSSVMATFADHSGKIAEIVMEAGREAGAEAAQAAEKAKDMTEKAVAGATKAVSNATSEASKGFAGAAKF
ncbi:MAG: phasin family protein [Rhodoblastus sp.]